jgi:uncharacterized protein (TIGR00730 family)
MSAFIMVFLFLITRLYQYCTTQIFNDYERASGGRCFLDINRRLLTALLVMYTIKKSIDGKDLSLKNICVFSGSNMGIRPEYQQAARDLGEELVARGLGLVYGGASVGLMGVIANTVLAGGGEVIGVIPRALFRREIAHKQLTTLHEVGSMHERKALMADLSAGFIALPGGFGTFDELFEITTWAQLGLHTKPIGLLNTLGYFLPLLTLVNHATTEGFIPAFHADILLQYDNPADLLDSFATYSPSANRSKWTDVPPER